ncbi:MAG TPA: SDR family oxidoreductase, partial [Terriglobales bacterium]|nr:SDR family oxidoreductase [Terriglobales bacterium]
MGHPALELKNKTAVVIGGTSGIGLTLALGLGIAGANVIPTGRRGDLVESTCEKLEQAGTRSLAVTSDVTNRDSLEMLLQTVTDRFGSVEILVNCAGITKKTPTLDLSEAEWSDILQTNLTGTLLACQVFGRHMVERKYGRIVNTASLSSYVGLYQVAAYAASKSGVLSLTKSLAVEWARKGVCVNALVPGVFRTALNSALLDGTPRGQEFLMRTPMHRFGNVEELVGATVFLSSDAASYVTGQGIVVDGGFLASGVN